MTRIGVPADRHAQRDAGRRLRSRVPRSAIAAVPALSGRDPIAILAAQNAARIPELVPLRRERMSESPFAFYRGAAAVMAADLARTAVTGVTVQICGVAHLSNFGMFASRDRRLVFDVNDFDETAPGPWEWDVKRLVTSLVIVARQQGMADAAARIVARDASQAYRRALVDLAHTTAMERFYAVMKVKRMLKAVRRSGADAESVHRMNRVVDKARRNTSTRALDKLTASDDAGAPRIVDQPPLTVRLPAFDQSVARELVAAYRRTVSPDVGALLDQFRVADVVLKVVGVGSVGTRCLLVLLTDPDGGPLFLQVKEASASVIEQNFTRVGSSDAGERVVSGQRIMQASGDPFLGSFAGPDGRDYYVRQFRDMKGGIDPLDLRDAAELSAYGRQCALALARAHAQSGRAATIAGYLGHADGHNAADAAFAECAVTTALQNDVDHAALSTATDAQWAG